MQKTRVLSSSKIAVSIIPHNSANSMTGKTLRYHLRFSVFPVDPILETIAVIKTDKYTFCNAYITTSWCNRHQSYYCPIHAPNAEIFSSIYSYQKYQVIIAEAEAIVVVPKPSLQWHWLQS